MVLAKAGQKMKETFVFLILNQFSSSQLLTDKNVVLLIVRKKGTFLSLMTKQMEKNSFFVKDFIHSVHSE